MDRINLTFSGGLTMVSLLKKSSMFIMFAYSGLLLAMNAADKDLENEKFGTQSFIMLEKASALGGTDTELLVKCLDFGKFEPFWEHIKTSIVKKLADHIDSLLKDDAQFLADTISVGYANQPKDRSRDAFKTVIAGYVNGLNLADIQGKYHAQAPSDARLNSLSNFNANLQLALMEGVCGFLDTLVPLNIPMLFASVIVADPSRDAFKNALTDAAFKD